MSGMPNAVNIIWSLIAILVVTCGFSHAENELPRNAILVFSADYENVNFNSEILGVGTGKQFAGDSFTIDCSESRSGNCSIMSKVISNSAYISDEAYRAESDLMAVKGARYSAGETFIYQFSLMIPHDWEVDSAGNIDSFWQFKRFNSKPDAFVAAKGDAIVLRVLEGKQITLLSPLPRGEWIDFRLLVKWSDNDDGIIEVVLSISGSDWRSAKLVGVNMWNDKPKAGYIKWGLYKPGKIDGSMIFGTRYVRHDDIRVYKLQN